jgi:hypothetical protein
MKTTAILTGGLLALLITAPLLAEDRGDRINKRLDNRGERINERLDKHADRLEANGHEKAAQHLDRKGDRIENRLDHRGDRIDRRADRRHGGDR